MMQLWIKFDGYDTWYYNLLFAGFSLILDSDFGF